MSEQVIQRQHRNIDKGVILRIFVLIVLVVVITVVNPNFLGSYNISSLLENVALILIMSIGTTFVLLIGSIDLSLGAIVSCGAVILARLLPVIGVWAYLILMLYGILAGFLNGVIFTKLKIPSFITTLATMSVYTSLALVISDSTPLQVDPSLKPITGWSNVYYGVFPLVFFLALIAFAIFWVVQEKTKFGKHCYAIGANEQAARVAGIRIDRTKIMVFTVAGFCFSLGAIIVTTKLMSGIPTVGASYTLLSIAAVALGGTSLAGGKGGLSLTLLGAFLSIIITNGMVVVGLDPYWQQIVYGIIVIVSLASSVDRKKPNLIVK